MMVNPRHESLLIFTSPMLSPRAMTLSTPPIQELPPYVPEAILEDAFQATPSVVENPNLLSAPLS